MSQYLGDISAYALAVSQGYTGTEEEYAELMASYATVGQTAVTAAQTATTKASEAATSATTATNKASEATTAATTATTKAGEASTSASTATSAKDTAVSASQTATSKASEATTAAATATSAKTDAVAANTAAQSAKTAAQTAQTGAETAAASVQSSAAQIATNTSDINELKEDLTTKADLDELYKAFPTDTASGSVASFADGANVPVKSLVVNIDPVQSGSGDPSPDNVRPISGWSEVNVVASGNNLADAKFGTQVPSISTGQMVNVSGWSTDYIPINNLHDYTFSAQNRNQEYILFYGENYSFLGAINGAVSGYNLSSFSQYQSVKYIKLRSDNIDNNNPFMQLESGSTATTYEPYSGQSITIALGQTVYGGTLDVVSGELVIDRAMVDLGTLNYSFNSAQGFMFSEPLPNAKSQVAGLPNAICSMYKLVRSNELSQAETWTFTLWNGGPYFKDSRYTDVTAFRTAVTGQTLVYELATPITVSLTPHEVRSLLGSNNVWADTGDSTVEYRADPTLYISRLTEPDADMVADANITSGSYFMVGNTLYKATANIASGGAITPNVNCTRKSLSEALNELNA